MTTRNRYTTFVVARVWESMPEAMRERTWGALEASARLDGHHGPYKRTESWYPHTDNDGRHWVLARLEVVA